jgi:radical SAM superfamily enzyme YgiQ (UPF0313 family)
MKILLIYPDMVNKEADWTGYYYEGVAVLASSAKAAGHSVRLLHVWELISDDEVVAWIEDNREEHTLVAFSATTNQFPYVRRWAKRIKEDTGLPTLVGGMHPTLSPEDAIATDGIDMICKGDGEKPLVALAEALANGRGPDGIDGIWYKDAKGEVVRQMMAPLADINAVPPPDFEIFENYRQLMVIKEGVGIHMGSRGCPYDCAYCCNRALIDMSKGRGKYMRFRDVPAFVEELVEYKQRYPETWAFFFEDDIFGVSKRWLKEFVPLYKEKVGLPYGCNMRPNLVDQWMVDQLADSGCIRVHMAIESGNEEIRNRILNRHLEHEKLVESFAKFQRAGVQVMSYNIVGSPHETPEAVLDTIKINAEINPDHIQHSIFFPYEGTPLFDLVHDEKLVSSEREVTDYFADTALEQDSIRRDQVLMFQQNFKPLVRHYQRLRGLPRPLGSLATAATDRFLTWGGAPRVMKALTPLGVALGKIMPQKGTEVPPHGPNGTNGTNGKNGAGTRTSRNVDIAC